MDSEERRVRHRPSRARSAPEREPVIHGDTSHAVFFLRTGVQLAEDDGNSHMTQGHSARSKRSAYPSTSRGELEALLQERALGACTDMPWGGVCTDTAVYTHCHALGGVHRHGGVH